MSDNTLNLTPHVENSAERKPSLLSAVEKHSQSRNEIEKYQREKPKETQEHYNNLTNYSELNHTRQTQDPTVLQNLQERISQSPIHSLQQEVLKAEERITEQLGLPRTSGYLFADFTPPEGDTNEDELTRSLWTHYEQKRIKQAENRYSESSNIVTNTLKSSVVKRIELQKYSPQPRDETFQRFEQEERRGLETFFGNLNKMYNETADLDTRRKILLLCQQISHFENNRLNPPTKRGEFRGTRLIVRDRRFWPIDTPPNMRINHNLKRVLGENDTQVENRIFVSQDSSEDEIYTLLKNIPDYTLVNQITGEGLNLVKNTTLNIQAKIDTSRSNEWGKAEVINFDNGDTLVGENHIKNTIDPKSKSKFNASLEQVNPNEHIILLEDYPSQFWGERSLEKSFIDIAYNYAKENKIRLGTLEEAKTQGEVAIEMQQLGLMVTEAQLEKITGISMMLAKKPMLPQGWKINQNLLEGMIIAKNIESNPSEQKNIKYQQLGMELENIHLSYIRDNRFINRIIEIKNLNPERKLFIVTGSGHTEALEKAYRGQARKQLDSQRIRQINNLIKELGI